MLALKAVWTITAGILPGTPMPEYCLQCMYTSADYAADGNQRGAKFEEMLEHIRTRAVALERGGLNWVKTEYLWL